MSPSRTRTSETLDPSWSTPTTASRRGTMNPVTRTKSEKQALVDFVTTTSALLGVSFSSGCGRCSNQYHAPPRAAKKTTAIAGLRYSERFIAGSIQDLQRKYDKYLHTVMTSASLVASAFRPRSSSCGGQVAPRK